MTSVTAEQEHPAFTSISAQSGATGRVLLVSDAPDDHHPIRASLEEIPDQTFHFIHAHAVTDALCQLGSGDFDIAFVDEHVADGPGSRLIGNAGGRLCATPMVLVSGAASENAARVEVPGGATDILLRDEISPALLLRIIRYARFNHKTTRRLIVDEYRHREIAAGASEANSHKTRFLAMMSHEFRTPLNAIIGFSEAIGHEIFGELGGEGARKYREYVQHIHSSGSHLLGLVNDLLDLSKIEAGKQEIHPAETDLRDVLDDVFRMVGPQADSQGVRLIDDLDDLPATVIFADARLMTQAVLNVVANAVKFSPGGETVSVAAKRQGRNVVVTVTDRGCGISKEELSRVVEPFHQAGTLETRPGRGTGLGLPLSSSIMNLHQGGLEITSEEGLGTAVALWLPCDMRYVAPNAV